MLLLPLLALASASVIAPEKPAGHGHVKVDFSVKRGDPGKTPQLGAEPRLVRRDGSAELELENMLTYYAAVLYLGLDLQKNEFIIDTGSSDLWVMDSDVLCEASSSYSKRSRARSLLLSDLFAETRLKSGTATASTVQEDEEKEDGAEQKRDYSVVYISYEQPAATATAGSGLGSAASCTAFGSFDTGSSDLFKVNSSAPSFSITYADGTSATGFWGHDSASFGLANVTDLSFAVVNETSSTIGVLGIGLKGLEVTYSGLTSNPYTYENLPMRLVSEGIINKNVYSLYLNKALALSGLLLFGAVDHAKYSGQLQTVPVVNIYHDYFTNPIRLDVVLDSITLQSLTQNLTITSSHFAALLDSGTTLTYLPTSILSGLVSLLSATLSSSGYYIVSCNYNSNSIYMTFNFSGIVIKVPFSDLILRSGNTCYLGILSQAADATTGYLYAILGDNFLRNAYIVYNLDDYEISMAQAEYTDDEDIEIVLSSVPLAVDAVLYSLTALASSVLAESSSSSLSSSKSSDAATRGFSVAALFGLLGVASLLVL